LSNWYVRRSRRRFWKSEDDGDKAAAYATLHYVLVRIAQLLAPWSPFVADKLWRGLTEGMDEAKSVHLSDWPEAGKVDKKLLNAMSMTRELIRQGLAVRAEAGIKVRQPLGSAEVYYMDPQSGLNELIKDELNVHELKFVNDLQVVGGDGSDLQPWIKLDTEITPELKAEGMMRDVVRHVQNARKESGLDVSDRIALTLETESEELAQAIAVHAEAIKAETLAKELKTEGASDQVPVKVNGEKLYVSVVKA
jgi:isoleucyl-tRNA synthetase